MEKKARPIELSKEGAVYKIQKAWRSYVDKRIFQYIKKVLLNKLST